MGKFTCALCKKTYNAGWSDEDANKEAKGIWGVEDASKRKDMVKVCEDCFQRMHPDKHPELREEAKRRLQNGESLK